VAIGPEKNGNASAKAVRIERSGVVPASRENGGHVREFGTPADRIRNRDRWDPIGAA
jgi:hypothetical protein